MRRVGPGVHRKTLPRHGIGRDLLEHPQDLWGGHTVATGHAGTGIRNPRCERIWTCRNDLASVHQGRFTVDFLRLIGIAHRVPRVIQLEQLAIERLLKRDLIAVLPRSQFVLEPGHGLLAQPSSESGYRLPKRLVPELGSKGSLADRGIRRDRSGRAGYPVRRPSLTGVHRPLHDQDRAFGRHLEPRRREQKDLTICRKRRRHVTGRREVQHPLLTEHPAASHDRTRRPRFRNPAPIEALKFQLAETRPPLRLQADLVGAKQGAFLRFSKASAIGPAGDDRERHDLDDMTVLVCDLRADEHAQMNSGPGSSYAALKAFRSASGSSR